MHHIYIYTLCIWYSVCVYVIRLHACFDIRMYFFLHILSLASGGLSSKLQDLSKYFDGAVFEFVNCFSTWTLKSTGDDSFQKADGLFFRLDTWFLRYLQEGFAWSKRWHDLLDADVCCSVDWSGPSTQQKVFLLLLGEDWQCFFWTA